LKDRIALVTGGAQGIGAAVALSLAEAGAVVVVSDLREPTGTLRAIRSAGGIARGVVCDVSDEESVNALFRGIASTERALDFAINAAGILTEARITEMPVAEFDRIVAVNLRGSFLIAREAAGMMQSARSGRIVFISSELACLGRADFTAYCASKAGVLGLTRALARELAPDIQVNSIAPGPVDTPMLAPENMSREWLEKELDIPLRRLGRPDEIGALARFLCGPDAGFFTGQTLSPNGGAVMI